MVIQGILDGQNVEICAIIPVGLDTYVAYKQIGLAVSATDIKIKKKTGVYGADSLSLLTSATSRSSQIAGVATSTEPTAVASGETAYFATTLAGKQIVQPYSSRPNFWRYASPAGGLVTSAGVIAKTAPPAGSRNCITSVQIMNTHPSISTEIEIRDGAGGTVLWRGWAQSGGGGASVTFPIPVVGTNTTAIEIAEVTQTPTTGVIVNLQGYVSAD